MNLSKGSILLATGDEVLCDPIGSQLQRYSFRVESVRHLPELSQLLHQKSYDGLVVEEKLDGESLLPTLPQLLSECPFMRLIVLTGAGQGSDEAARGWPSEHVKFIPKEHFSSFLDRDQGDWFAGPLELSKRENGQQIKLIGNSPRMKELFQEIKKVSEVDATVLLSGPSGTGKEIFARYIHQMSRRRNKVFEAINCGAIPDALLESELFGHVKGAFTDARSNRKGMFEVCNEGTLFLDEIGEMPLHLQVKLLRVLQEKEIRPVGANHTLKINTRVICATNKDLEEEVKAKRFREDLYFRLSVFPIELPSLQERPEDIKTFVTEFVASFNTLYHKNVQLPSALEFEKICSYSWPGNIRQLKNAVERGVVLAENNELMFDNMLPRAKRRDGSAPIDILTEWHDNYFEAKAHFERQYIERLLRKTGGNVSEVARISGRFRSDIYRLLDKYELRGEDYRNIVSI